MIKTARRAASAAAVIMTSAIVLSACGAGSSDDAAAGDGPAQKNSAVTAQKQTKKSEGVVYEFEEAKDKQNEDSIHVLTTENTITVRLSDELKKAAEPVGDPLVESYTFTTKAFPTGICRVDIDIEYTDNAPELAEKATEWLYNDEYNYVMENRRDDSTEPIEISRLSPERFLIMYLIPSKSDYEDINFVDSIPVDEELGSDYEEYYTSDVEHVVQSGPCVNGEAVTHMDVRDIAMPYIQEDGYPNDDVATFDYAVTDESGTGENATFALIGETSAEVSATGAWQPMEPEEKN